MCFVGICSLMYLRLPQTKLYRDAGCLWSRVKHWRLELLKGWCLWASFRPPSVSAIWKTDLEWGSRKDLHVLTKHKLTVVSISFLGNKEIPEPVGMYNQGFKFKTPVCETEKTFSHWISNMPTDCTVKVSFPWTNFFKGQSSWHLLCTVRFNCLLYLSCIYPIQSPSSSTRVTSHSPTCSWPFTRVVFLPSRALWTLHVT